MGEVSNKSYHNGYCFDKSYYLEFFPNRFLCSALFIDLGLDTDFHNQEMEFPTVTVCPLDPFDEDKVNETAYRKMADYDDNYLDYVPILEILSRLSYDNMEMAYQEVSNLKEKLANEKKTTLRQLVFDVAMPCENLFYDCKFRGESISCCDFFKPVYTERGFCFGFNTRYIGTKDGEWVCSVKIDYIKFISTKNFFLKDQKRRAE